MELARSAGVLLHIASLPSRYGLGDLGPSAYAFADWLRRAGQSWWQILPFGPADDPYFPRPFDDPYTCQSSWAGSPLFVSLDLLVEAGDLRASEAHAARLPDRPRIDWDRVKRTRRALLDLAAERFFSRRRSRAQLAFMAFSADESGWLDDWALFSTVKRVRRDTPWWRWPRPLKNRDRKALRGFAVQHAQFIRAEKYIQFRFFEQWQRLRTYLQSRGIGIIGDMPIYTAGDSADVWANRHLFKLQPDGRPGKMAGVPPDYYSSTGQLWGNPVYDWSANRSDRFRWWIERLRGSLRWVDIVRIDHFRGLADYWEVPAGSRTAQQGRWVKGPGDAFLSAVRGAFGDVPLIAEDLGIITPEVTELRDRWSLPGMRVLQFAFPGNSIHLPHLFPSNCIAYTGTHDNDTSAGWYRKAGPAVRAAMKNYIGSSIREPHIALLRLLYSSVAAVAVVPIQDVLGLGSRARLNTPGADHGRYKWKLLPRQLTKDSATFLRQLAETYGRTRSRPRKHSRHFVAD